MEYVNISNALRCLPLMASKMVSLFKFCKEITELDKNEPTVETSSFASIPLRKMLLQPADGFGPGIPPFLVIENKAVRQQGQRSKSLEHSKCQRIS